jgi:hypothetical protein
LLCQGFNCGPSAILSARVGGVTGNGCEFLLERLGCCDVLDTLDLSELGLSPNPVVLALPRQGRPSVVSSVSASRMVESGRRR